MPSHLRGAPTTRRREQHATLLCPFSGGEDARTELAQIFSSPTIVSSEPLDFTTCSWVRSRYLRTSSLPPPGLYSPKDDLRAHAVHGTIVEARLYRRVELRWPDAQKGLQQVVHQQFPAPMTVHSDRRSQLGLSRRKLLRLSRRELS